MDAISRVGAVGFDEALRCFFDLGDGVGIEKFTEVGLADEFAKLVLVDRQSLGAALGEGGIAIVDEVCYVAEEER